MTYPEPVTGAGAARDCLGVIHIPKSGGVALRSALTHLEVAYTGPLYFDHPYFGLSDYVWSTPSPNRETIAATVDLQSVVANHCAVIGHHSGPQLLAAGCNALAVQLREPRSRLLSLYRYWQSQPRSVLEGWGRWGSSVVARAISPFHDFLSHPDVWPATDNLLARQTLGLYTSSGPALLRRQRLSRAYRVILHERPFIAEWNSSSDRFLERICERLGIETVPPIGRDNVTDVVGDQQVLDAATRRLLDRFTSVDRLFLDRLCSDRILPSRSHRDLDSDFELTADRLHFTIK